MAHTRGILIQSLQQNWPTSQEAAQKKRLKGRTQMKLKSSIDCCTVFARSTVQRVFARRITKLFLALLCCALPMALAAPARADVCSDAFNVTGCGVTINITGTSSGLLTATIVVTGNGAYDGIDDELVGIT